MEKVILVDITGKEIGWSEKIEAHKKGLLHKAFSIFIFNKKGEMLIQKRSKNKYHFAGLWSNACCSHPRAGEETMAAGRRRLLEELGVETKLSFLFSFIYRADDKKSGLTEYEFDEVFSGIIDSEIIPFNKDEIEEISWISLNDLDRSISQNPENYTYWFLQSIERVKTFWPNLL